jgi:hypothetical protein
VALAQSGLHGGELLDELDGGLAVLGGAGGEPELAAQVVEERGVAQDTPQLRVVEGREGEEEVGHGLPLLAEQGGEVVGKVSSGHALTVTSTSDNQDGSASFRTLRGPVQSLPRARSLQPPWVIHRATQRLVALADLAGTLPEHGNATPAAVVDAAFAVADPAATSPAHGTDPAAAVSSMR